MSKRLG